MCVRMCAGVVKQSVPVPNAVGGPVMLNCNGDYLAAITEDHKVHVFKVAGREAKPHMGPGLLFKNPADSAALKVDMLRVNSSGNMVAVLCSSKERSREPCLYVLCFENNETLTYDFSKVWKPGLLHLFWMPRTLLDPGPKVLGCMQASVASVAQDPYLEASIVYLLQFMKAKDLCMQFPNTDCC
eukprot:scaffold17229_cov20-Tisochrysis_lutea.AAC.1